MTPERIKELRNTFNYVEIVDGLTECLDEIERLQTQRDLYREALVQALNRAAKHRYGCLYCGGDEDYVEEHEGVSEEHKDSCWYYKARKVLEENK